MSSAEQIVKKSQLLVKMIPPLLWSNFSNQWRKCGFYDLTSQISGGNAETQNTTHSSSRPHLGELWLLFLLFIPMACVSVTESVILDQILIHANITHTNMWGSTTFPACFMSFLSQGQYWKCQHCLISICHSYVMQFRPTIMQLQCVREEQ